MSRKLVYLISYIILLSLTLLLGMTTTGVRCRLCSQGGRAECQKSAHLLETSILCPEKCMVVAAIDTRTKQFTDFARTCLTTGQSYMGIGPSQPENSCMFDGHRQVRCVTVCDNSDFCNENMTWTPPGWLGRIIPSYESIEVRRWRYLGHSLRRKESLPHTSLGWAPEGTRRRGRPKETWRRTALKQLKVHNIKSWAEAGEMARDRERWKGKEKAILAQYSTRSSAT